MDQISRSGEGKRYHLITFGCQMNEHDSEIMAGILENIGFEAVADLSEADLIVINTCAVRKKPEEKVGGLLGKLKPLKEQKRDLVIAVGGCMTQQAELAQYIKQRFSHVNLIFGTHSLTHFPQLLEEAIIKGGTVVDLEENQDLREGLPIRRTDRYKAWLPIIYGCNNFCSYCVVPYVRGRERSRPLEDIVNEAHSLAREGYLELTLLGQNVNSYGQDRPETYDFADLLLELDKVDGISRIRFMTSHPKDLSPRLIETVARGGKICEHFHLPVQSGSNRILEVMNRRYTREHYLDLIRDIKLQIPGVAVTSDIIVGFPGETEYDYLDTMQLLEAARFDNAFTFIYSPRRGTKAAEMTDHEPRAQKERRLQKLSEIQQRISLDLNRELVDLVVEVLVEGRSKSNPVMLSGRTRTNKLVHFPSTLELTGRLVPVKICEARTWNLIGEEAG
ncbi:MAG: tRNA (N6-isopentenyl adenosine(37)-C2)-methylthiotransferase MiaB [Dethiobacter sp.]|nr:tRNA (N6-isopentenyl adenosine(37)-C2)-methylthiotransferase MiaB [Dethiobacter sp.]